MKAIPIIYHPTTITLIDDDSNLLKSLNLSLSEHFRCRSFVSAVEAKNTILKEHKKVGKKFLTIGYEDLSDISVTLEISKIYKEVYNKDRFSPSVVAIIDYDMPDINGLELSKILKANTPIKIIMLTGEADKDTAVDAFNNKEIDRFVQKSAPNYHEKLIEYIRQLQLEYFVEASAGLLDSLSSKKGHPLHDADFIALVNEICGADNIVEYYLLEESGSLLMYDSAGNATWIIVRMDEDMQTFLELAEGETSSDAILNSLKKREKIAIFKDRENPIPPISDWGFHPATQLRDKKIYYCVLKGDEPGIKMNKIVSYEQFLHS